MDAVTGLLYVGNGQYYDPSTGRFLSRGVNPEGTNPYTPWNPIGAMIGPLGLISFFFGRKKKGSKVGTFLALFLVIGSMSMTLAACGGGGGGGQPPTVPPGTPISGVGTSTGSGVATPEPSSTPLAVPCPEPKNWLPDKVIFTRYVTVKENDPFFTPNDPTLSNAVPIEKTPGGQEVILAVVPVWRFYVGNADTPTWSVYWNGSGELNHSDSLSMSSGKKYVQADTNNKPLGFNAAYYFTDQLTGTCGNALNANENIIAVAGNLFGQEGHKCGDTYYLDVLGLEDKIFTVRDRGTFVVENGQPDHFDIYVGIQDRASFDASPLAQYDGQLIQIAKARL